MKKQHILFCLGTIIMIAVAFLAGRASVMYRLDAFTVMLDFVDGTGNSIASNRTSLWYESSPIGGFRVIQKNYKPAHYDLIIVGPKPLAAKLGLKIPGYLPIERTWKRQTEEKIVLTPVEPNKASEPTPATNTPSAGQQARQP